MPYPALPRRSTAGKIDVQPLQVVYRGLSTAALQGQRDNGKIRPAFLIDWVETRSVDEAGMRAWGSHRTPPKTFSRRNVAGHSIAMPSGHLLTFGTTSMWNGPFYVA